MSEYNKEKLYYFWMKEDFFERTDTKILEKMPNGKDYVIFYLKLLCKSISHKGLLRFNEMIPLNTEMLSTLTNTNIDIVRSAMQVLEQFGLIEIFDDKTIFMKDIENLIGCTTKGAEKKVLQRKNKQQLLGGGQKGDKCPPYIDINKDIDIYKDINIDKDINININKDNNSPLSPQREREQLTAIYDSYSFDDDVNKAIRLWLKYKKEKKQGYKPIGLTTLLNRLKKDCEEKGNSYVIRNIEFSIENNYSGIYESKEKTQNTIKQPIGICEDRERLLKLIKGEQQ